MSNPNQNIYNFEFIGGPMDGCNIDFTYDQLHYLRKAEEFIWDGYWENGWAVKVQPGKTRSWINGKQAPILIYEFEGDCLIFAGYKKSQGGKNKNP